MSRDGTTPRIDRRALLRALGASGAAAGLAGCSDETTREFAATPVVLAEPALAASLATERGVETVRESRLRSLGDRDVPVAVESHLAVYDAGRANPVAFGDAGTDRPSEESEQRTGAVTPVDARTVLGSPTSVGVLATPDAAVRGRSVNPLARASLADLVAGDRGRRLLADAGVGVDGEVVGAFESAGAVSTSDLVGAAPQTDVAGAVAPARFERFVGAVRDDAGDPAVVVVIAGRDGVDGDVVVVAAATRRRLPGGEGSLADRPAVGADGLVTEGGLAAATASLATLVPFLVPEGTDLPFDPAVAALGPGEYVSDGDDGTPDLAVVVRAFDDVPAESWTVYGDETVADHNPGYDPSEPVVLVAYEGLLDAGWQEWRAAGAGTLYDEVVDRGVKFHAFPRSRLRRHLVGHDGA